MRGNMVLKRPGEASWVTYIKKRIDNNLNFLSITTGPVGSGKSFTDLSIASQLDSEFDPSEQVVFTFGQFMSVIKKFNNQVEEEIVEGKTPLNKRKYKVVIFEESQTAVNKREWASKVNKLFLKWENLKQAVVLNDKLINSLVEHSTGSNNSNFSINSFLKTYSSNFLDKLIFETLLTSKLISSPDGKTTKNMLFQARNYSPKHTMNVLESIFG
jgi:hypothetical protein